MASHKIKFGYLASNNGCVIVFFILLLAIFSYSRSFFWHNQNVYSKTSGKSEEVYLLYYNEFENNVTGRLSNGSIPFIVPNVLEKSATKRSNESEKLLYRKRRYLLFPEGSSFQLVFDLIIPIVDYTNYAIMGITCAVAWELPSKAPSEIHNELLERLNDGTLGTTRNDTIDNIQYVDTSKAKRPPNNHLSRIIYVQPSEFTAYDGTRHPLYTKTSNENNDKVVSNAIKSYYNERRPVYYAEPGRQPPFVLKSINNEKIDAKSNNLWKLGYRKDYPRERVPPRRPIYNSQPNQHAVYHIMGRRSLPAEQSDKEIPNAWLETLDRIHLQYHRSSRHVLYSKIEAMLFRQKQNGTECILRALCETGKKRSESQPGSLINEILRTVFTLPRMDSDMPAAQHHHKSRVWDEAHWDHRNCSEIYSQCEKLPWN